MDTKTPIFIFGSKFIRINFIHLVNLLVSGHDIGT